MSEFYKYIKIAFGLTVEEQKKKRERLNGEKKWNSLSAFYFNKHNLPLNCFILLLSSSTIFKTSQNN